MTTSARGGSSTSVLGQSVASSLTAVNQDGNVSTRQQALQTSLTQISRDMADENEGTTSFRSDLSISSPATSGKDDYRRERQEHLQALDRSSERLRTSLSQLGSTSKTQDRLTTTTTQQRVLSNSTSALSSSSSSTKLLRAEKGDARKSAEELRAKIRATMDETKMPSGKGDDEFAEMADTIRSILSGGRAGGWWCC